MSPKTLRIVFQKYKSAIENSIVNCQKLNHTQQVAVSTYHNAVTQICFTCGRVTTNMPEKDCHFGYCNPHINSVEHNND